MKRIFEFFDESRIINLRDRPDRREEMEKELLRIGIEPNSTAGLSFFTADRVLKAEKQQTEGYNPRGALVSHREIIREALERDVQSLLILEDDVFFRDFDDRQIERLIEQLETKEWEIVYFGYLDPKSLPDIEPLQEWTGRTIGGHFYGMRQSYMREILEFMDGFGQEGAPNPVYRDGAFNLHFEMTPGVKRFLAAPSLATQRSSRTDLHELAFYDRIPGLKSIADAARQLRNLSRRRGG